MKIEKKKVTIEEKIEIYKRRNKELLYTFISLGHACSEYDDIIPFGLVQTIASTIHELSDNNGRLRALIDVASGEIDIQ